MATGSSAYTAIHDLYGSWRYYIVAAPLAMTVVSFLLGALIFDLDHPFIATFSAAELLPLAALVLLGVSAEIENDAIFSKSAELSYLRYRQNFFVIIVVAVYGAMKGSAHALLESGPLTEASVYKLNGFAVFSIGCAVAAVVAANYSKTRLLDKQTRDI
jgi:hypothetical protein